MIVKSGLCVLWSPTFIVSLSLSSSLHHQEPPTTMAVASSLAEKILNIYAKVFIATT